MLNLAGFKAKGAAGNASTRAIESKLKRNAMTSKRTEPSEGADAGGSSLLGAFAPPPPPEQGDDDEEEEEDEEAAPPPPRERIRRQW